MSSQRLLNQSKFPPGWDEQRVQRVLAHYEEQTEEEAVVEDKAAFTEQTQMVMKIPTRSAPDVERSVEGKLDSGN